MEKFATNIPEYVKTTINTILVCPEYRLDAYIGELEGCLHAAYIDAEAITEEQYNYYWNKYIKGDIFKLRKEAEKEEESLPKEVRDTLNKWKPLHKNIINGDEVDYKNIYKITLNDIKNSYIKKQITQDRFKYLLEKYYGLGPRRIEKWAREAKN